MESEKKIDARKERDRWDKADVIFKMAASVITTLAALVIAYYGSLISNSLEERKLQATYTDLLSRREEADGTLRKDMFKSIIDSFLDPKSTEAPLGRKILNLELLTHNFHDALNLKPLFTNLRDEIDQFEDLKIKERYLTRIDEVAMEISRKQMLILEQHGKTHADTIDLGKLKDEHQLIEWTETLAQIKRKFSIVVLEADTNRKKLKVSLRVADLNKDSRTFGQTMHHDFRVGFFDFPMIDNTRLSDNQRCAVVLNHFDGPVAEIQVVYFSGDYASLKGQGLLSRGA